MELSIFGGKKPATSLTETDKVIEQMVGHYHHYA